MRKIKFLLIMFFVAGLRAATITVSSTGDAGAGTLRDAITTANGNVDLSNIINFSISGTLNLLSSLPTITKQLTIDGTGQNFIIDGNDTTTIGLDITAAAPNSIIQNITIQDIGIAPSVGQDSTGIIVSGISSQINSVTIIDVAGVNNLQPAGAGGDAFGITINANNVIVQNGTISNITGGLGDSSGGGVAIPGGNGGLARGIALDAITGASITGNTISDVNGGNGGTGGAIVGTGFDGGNGGEANGVFIASGGTNNTIQNNNISDNDGGNGGFANATITSTAAGNGGNAGLGVSIRVDGNNNIVSQNMNLTGNSGGVAGKGGLSNNNPGNGGNAGLGASIQINGDSNMISSNMGIGGNSGGTGGDGGDTLIAATTTGDGGNGGDGIGIALFGSDNTTNLNNVLATNTGGSGGVPGVGGVPGIPGVVGEPFGVLVDTGNENKITQNDITGNALHFGIALQNNGNDNQVEPTMVMLSICNGTFFSVEGELNNNNASLGNRNYIIEFFNNAASADPEQGRTFVGQIEVTTGADGNVSFFEDLMPIAPINVGDFITSTATINSGLPIDNTSEFSVPVAVEDGQDVDDMSVSTEQNTPVAILLSGMSGTPQTFEIKQPPTNGTLSAITPLTGPPNVTAEITYTPNDGFTGIDSFVYSFTDDECNGIVTIVVLTGDPNKDLTPLIKSKYMQFCNLVPIG